MTQIKCFNTFMASKDEIEEEVNSWFKQSSYIFKGITYMESLIIIAYETEKTNA